MNPATSALLPYLRAPLPRALLGSQARLHPAASALPCRAPPPRTLLGGLQRSKQRRAPAAPAARGGGGEGDNDDLDDDIQRLEALFYSQVQAHGGEQEQEGAAEGEGGEEEGAEAGVYEDDVIRDLPMFLVQWGFLPGSQDVLHIFVPHYVHMFETLMRAPRPWLYGHALQPGGSKGDPRGARAVGAVCEVLDVQRTKDGRMLLRTRAIGRMRKIRGRQETPYKSWDVVWYDDYEWVMAGVARGEAAAREVRRAEDVLSGEQRDKFRILAKYTGGVQLGSGVKPGQIAPEEEERIRKAKEEYYKGEAAGAGDERTKGQGMEGRAEGEQGGEGEEGGGGEEGGREGLPAVGRLDGLSAREVVEQLLGQEEEVWALYDHMRGLMGELRMDKVPPRTPDAIDALRPPPREGEDVEEEEFAVLARCNRLSYSLAASEVPEISRDEGRQALLEAPGTSERMELLRDGLQQRVNTLAATLAVKQALRKEDDDDGRG